LQELDVRAERCPRYFVLHKAKIDREGEESEEKDMRAQDAGKVEI